MDQLSTNEVFAEASFDGDLWAWKALEDFINYKCLHEYVSNSSAVETHRESIRSVHVGPSFSDEDVKRLRQEYVGDLAKALVHLASQTLVTLCTTFEIASKNFFFSMFVRHPERMFEYVGGEDQKGHVKLTRILNAEDYDGLILDLARSASTAASKGDYSKVLKRAAKLCKSDADGDLLRKIDQLQRDRNKVVHEKYSPDWNFEDVSKAHEVVADCVANFCRLGLAADIPGSYTFVGPEISIQVSSAIMVDGGLQESDEQNH